MADFVEKRRFVRVKSDFDVMCYIGNMIKAPIKCQTRDVSLGGLKLFSPSEFIEGFELIVKIYLPFSNIPVEVVSEIRWAKKSTVKPGFYETGVQFTFLSAAQLKIVSDYVNRVLALES